MVKITRPKASGVVLRRRLFHAINKCLQQGPVLWLSGPAGSGKTTLVSSYIEAANLPCLWYQIDERDGDIASFFSWMGLAVRKARPEAKNPMPVFTPEYSLGVAAFSRDYFEEIYRRLGAPSVLVFDNYQTVPGKSRLHEVMDAAFSGLPENIHAIVISRSGPDPRLIRLRANGLMSLMAWDQLRFTAEELGEVIQRQLSKNALTLPENALARIHEKSDGWIAGIVLMLQAIEADGVGAVLEQENTATGIFDYFASELLQGASEQVQRVLLQSAFLPVLSADLVCKLSGVENAGQVLDQLSFKNYFTTKHPGKEPTFQFHPLFRDFLVHQAKANLSAEELTLLKKDTANALVAAGQIEDAADLVIETQGWKSLVQLVTSSAPSLVEQGRYSTLEKWIDALPSQLLGATAWMLYWKAVCRMQFDPIEARDRFEIAYRQFQEEKDAAGILLAACGIVESIQYSAEDAHQLDAWIDRLPGLVGEWGGFPSEEVEVRVAAAMCRALTWRQPMHPDFDSWTRRALRDRDINSKIRTLSFLSFHYAARGFLAEADSYGNQLYRLASAANHSPLGLIWMKLCEEVKQDLSGRRDNSIREGLQIAEKTGVHMFDFVLLANDVVVALNQGDAETAHSSILKLDSMIERFQPLGAWYRSFYDYILAYRAYCNGELNEARMHADSVLQNIDKVGVPVSCLFSRTLCSVIFHDLGELERANQLLEESATIGREIGSVLSRFEYYLHKAQFSLGRACKKDLLAHVQEAMAIGKQHNLFGVYGALPPSVLARLAAIALENGIEVEYVQELIRRRGLAPPEPPVHLESWPWPLKIHVLGEFRIEKDGKPLVFSGKLQRKPLAVLKAILASGERGVSEEQLIDFLWPEAEGDAAHAAFKMALSRLRKLIGIDDSVRFHEGRLLLDPSQCWVDARAFERAARRAEDRGGDQESRVAAMEKALSLYKGAFLPSDTGLVWTSPMREHLRGRHIAVARALAQYWEKSSDDEKAASCYQRMLEVDHLAEDFYRHPN